MTGPLFKFTPESETGSPNTDCISPPLCKGRTGGVETGGYLPQPLPSTSSGQALTKEGGESPDPQPLLAYKRPSEESKTDTLPQSTAGATRPLTTEIGTAKNVRHNVASLVDGSAGRATTRGEKWWEAPQGLEKDVAFWRDIYTKYSANDVVLHDPEHLHIVYEVVDVADIMNNPALPDAQKRAMKKLRVEGAVNEVTATLKLLDTDREAALRTKRGKNIAALFINDSSPQKFKRALEAGVRSQTGQRDKFVAGLKHAGAWLGEIETIFTSYGLPKELTRLIFVESMFQTQARSKVGAAGIWQFMRDTGAKYLRINRFVDERLDPIAETHAAAKLLKHNYEALGTWPLAINAYNAGRGRLEQAVARMGTTDIGTIIKGFDHPAYGFASRNFFLEFVAAREAVDNASQFFGAIEYEKPLSYDVVELPFFVALPAVAKLSNISMSDLMTLNPQFSDEVFAGELPLPAGTTVRLPENKGQHFAELAQRTLGRTHAPFEHIVAGGETLPEIASLYGVPVENIREANPALKQKPREGQKIVIPVE